MVWPAVLKPSDLSYDPGWQLLLPLSGFYESVIILNVLAVFDSLLCTLSFRN